jgi:hypothetical protein
VNRSQFLDYLYLSYLEKKFYNKEPIESKAGIFYKRREKEESDFGSRRKKESEEEEAASASR